ncbi:MAG TPA: ELWxxDGT repeat protein, partial [Anaerolineales bacterium]|nr:ELWxxDGT repeat protein [Anaerolineales bacterium]
MSVSLIAYFKVDNTLFFNANDGITGAELWKSDGTLSGTVQIQDIYPGIGSSYPGNFGTLGAQILFAAINGTAGFELWKSDGSTVTFIKDINPYSADAGTSYIVNMKWTLFFRASDGDDPGHHGAELWKSDGTAAGTSLVKDILAGTGSS